MYLPAPFPIIAVLGPTATGKTAVAIRLALRLQGEIVNLDSIQLYRELNIGSAKPSSKEQALVPHHLIDILWPDEVMDAPTFAQRASFAMRHIIRRGRVPILVGGTGFYLKGIFQGFSRLPGKNPGLRQVLENLARKRGRDFIYQMLQEVDPEAAKRIHSQDIYRVIRMLEVYFSSSEPFSRLCRQRETVPAFSLGSRRLIKVGLMLERNRLYERIDRRVEEMLRDGFVEEVRGLLEKGYYPKLKPLQSIGYRHIISYLHGNKGLEDAVQEMKRDTRHYAKRQLTWFRKEKGIRWFNPEILLQSKDIWQAIN